jgi:hypothetical protein
MGILTKLKEAVSGKPAESLKEFELELYRIKQKCKSKIVALMGIGGRLKGLPLIYTSDDDNIRNVTSAKLYEILSSVIDITGDKKVNDFILNCEGEVLIFKPLMENIGLFAIIPDEGEIPHIREWIDKKIPMLESIFEGRL